ISSPDFVNFKAMSDAPPAKNTEMTELPSDLFMEILSWIPATTLLKLRCVCKCWYSITTDPIFVRLHLQQQQLLPEVTSVLTVHRDFTNDRSLLSRLDVVDALWVAKHVAIWHSPPLLVVSPPCHGLFCLYHTYMEFDVCLYNPATRKSFSLPQNFTSVKNVGFLFAEAKVSPGLSSARVRWSVYMASSVESELGVRFERCLLVQSGVHRFV
ncbi:hypothetical protein B296_00054576, partial [Ensete ventricosum]